MGAIGRAASWFWRLVKKVFTTAEHTTRTSVYWIRDNAVESGAEFRQIGRDFFASLRKIDKKHAPPILFFIGFVSLVVATLYLLRLFDNLPSLREDMTIGKALLSMIIAGFMFGQYIFHVMAVFKLSSGMKIAWASMMRTSFSYVILMVVTESSLMRLLPINVVAYESWILVGIMVLVILLMCTGKVREYYTPAYAEPVSLKEWILYILYQDPFKEQIQNPVHPAETE